MDGILQDRYSDDCEFRTYDGMESDRTALHRRIVRHGCWARPRVSRQGGRLPHALPGGFGVGVDDDRLPIRFRNVPGLRDGARFDPSRIAAQVVSGIGFIGAGTIIIHRRMVRGLTTAASLWATAGVGLASGAGMYAVAAAATLLTLFGLEALSLFFGKLGRRRTMIVFSSLDRTVLDAVFDRLSGRDYSVVSYEVEPVRTADGTLYRASLVIRARGAADPENYIAELRRIAEITIEKIV